MAKKRKIRIEAYVEVADLGEVIGNTEGTDGEMHGMYTFGVFKLGKEWVCVRRSDLERLVQDYAKLTEPSHE